MQRIRVAVVDENEIFRRGVIACLAADPAFEVVYHAGEVDPEASVALFIVSAEAASRATFPSPVVVCTDAVAAADRARAGNVVAGVLPRNTLTTDQLVNGVRAAASGLQVNMAGQAPCDLTPRNLEVLRMLADGAATKQISERLGYSERTIKNAIAEIVQELGARSRAEAVAMGIRRGLI